MKHIVVLLMLLGLQGCENTVYPTRSEAQGIILTYKLSRNISYRLVTIVNTNNYDVHIKHMSRSWMIADKGERLVGAFVLPAHSAYYFDGLVHGPAFYVYRDGQLLTLLVPEAIP